jgi:hypothetical protein
MCDTCVGLQGVCDVMSELLKFLETVSQLGMSYINCRRSLLGPYRDLKRQGQFYMS